jgi:hypothetical protein
VLTNKDTTLVFFRLGLAFPTPLLANSVQSLPATQSEGRLRAREGRELVVLCYLSGILLILIVTAEMACYSSQFLLYTD